MTLTARMDAEVHRLREVERRARERRERLQAVDVDEWRRWRARDHRWGLWHVLGPDHKTLCGKPVPFGRINELPAARSERVPAAARCKRCNLIASDK